MADNEIEIVNRMRIEHGERPFCQFRIRIPRTVPVLFRPCKHPVAEGETHCARHGGLPIRPRRHRALLARLRRTWRALVR